MKQHFLMEKKVLPIHNQPLLMKEEVKFTRIVVHQTLGVSGTSYTVMFLGTDRGFLYKAVVVGSQAHIIEDFHLFGWSEPVRNMLLSPEKGVLYVGHFKGVLRVPMAECYLYESCSSCVEARDPYCAWDSNAYQCRNVWSATEDTAEWLQDIETGDVNAKCQSRSGKPRTSSRSSSYSDGNRETKSLHCNYCLMNDPEAGCLTGNQDCLAEVGEKCMTIKIMCEGKEKFRIQGCSRNGQKGCGLVKESQGHSLKITCCSQDDCNK